MTWSGRVARGLAVAVAVCGTLIAYVAFDEWFAEAHRGYHVDADGPIGEALAAGLAEPFVVAEVIGDECHELILLTALVSETDVEELVGDPDFEPSEHRDRLLLVALDDAGRRVHAEHVPQGAGIAVDDIRRLDCNRPYEADELAAAT